MNELLIAKQNLILAQRGHDLLEIKYNALLLELNRTEKLAAEIRAEYEKLLRAAKHAAALSEMESGKPTAFEEIPYPYKLNETSSAFDKAYFLSKEASETEKKLSEIEKLLSHLKTRTSRAKKRASALRNITIPTLIQRIKYIKDKTEEHERDEMVRIKAVKNKFHNN